MLQKNQQLHRYCERLAISSFLFPHERRWQGMSTYEALSVIAQFGLVQIANMTLTVTIVVYLIKRSNRS